MNMIGWLSGLTVKERKSAELRLLSRLEAVGLLIKKDRLGCYK